MLGVLISCLGLKTIVAFALPVLSLLYPVMVFMVVMSLFHYQIHKDAVFKGAAIVTLIVSTFLMMESFGTDLSFTRMIPFFDNGFGWIIPAVVGGIIGRFIGKKSSLSERVTKEEVAV